MRFHEFPRTGGVVGFTRHAERRAGERGIATQDVAELVLSMHDRRRRDPGEADWLVRGRGIAAAYNWPDEGDDTTALVISVWRE